MVYQSNIKEIVSNKKGEEKEEERI